MLIGLSQLHIVLMGEIWMFICKKKRIFLILFRTNPVDLLAEFGIHDRYSIERSRVSRKIKQVIIVC